MIPNDRDPVERHIRNYYSKMFVEQQRFSLYLRFTLVVVVVLFVAMIMSQFLSLAPYFKGMLEAKHEIMKAEAEGLKQIPDLEHRITSLEKRTRTLTSESIDARLQKIETAIKVGEVKAEDLSSLQDLRDDLDQLKRFMSPDPDKLVELRTLQRDYQELKQTKDKMMPKDDILREIDSTKNLFYVLFGVLATFSVASLFFSFRRRPEREIPTLPKEEKEENT